MGSKPRVFLETAKAGGNAGTEGCNKDVSDKTS